MCQGFDHLALDCTNRRFITLDEWEAVKEHGIEEDNKGDLKETLEKIVVKADEGDMLLLERTRNSPKEDKAEQSFRSSSTFSSKLCSLLFMKETVHMMFLLTKLISLLSLMTILNSTNHKRDQNILISFLLLASHFSRPHTLSLHPSKIGFSMIKRNQNLPYQTTP